MATLIKSEAVEGDVILRPLAFPFLHHLSESPTVLGALPGIGSKLYEGLQGLLSGGPSQLHKTAEGFIYLLAQLTTMEARYPGFRSGRNHTVILSRATRPMYMAPIGRDAHGRMVIQQL
jgi:hypothetical protein